MYLLGLLYVPDFLLLLIFIALGIWLCLTYAGTDDAVVAVQSDETEKEVPAEEAKPDVFGSSPGEKETVKTNTEVSEPEVTETVVERVHATRPLASEPEPPEEKGEEDLAVEEEDIEEEVTSTAESGPPKKPVEEPLEVATERENVSYQFDPNNIDDPQDAAEPEEEYEPHPQTVYTTEIAEEPPENFHAEQIQESAPPAAPPTGPAKPYKNINVFHDVDSHALQVAQQDHKDFRIMLWHLIYARGITNELDKARAIFIWLCSKDLNSLHFTDPEPGSPEEALMDLVNEKTTYSTVYKTLCSYAGLHCILISGYAKGHQYHPGMKFTNDQGKHSWNAVVVNGGWRLVDCNWAARRLVGKTMSPENLHYNLEEYYFMPDPHQLIFSHFPEDPSWQLLERPVTLEHFEDMVLVKSSFFKHGLQLLSHRKAILDTDGHITIRIGCVPPKIFSFSLVFEDGREEFQNISLKRFGMQETFISEISRTDKKDMESHLTLRLPEKGRYRVHIFTKDRSEETQEGVYNGVCEYGVTCDAPQTPKPFPPCVHTTYGPGDSAFKHKLVPINAKTGAVYKTVNGKVDIKFHYSDNLRFNAKLKSNDKDHSQLDGYLVDRVVGDEAIFSVTAPSCGEYGLEVYANDPDVDGNTLYHAYQCLIICDDARDDVVPLPSMPPSYLGPQPTYSSLGLTTATHSDPYICNDNGTLVVGFSMATPIQMTSQLIFASKDAQEDMSKHVLQQGRDNQAIFLLHLPKAGVYKFQLFALPPGESGENYPGVYNYVINCTATLSDPTPFPTQYSIWKKGCYLYAPQKGPFNPSGEADVEVEFKVSVPEAEKVAVVVDQAWTQLDKKDDTWEGKAVMKPGQTKAQLCASFGESSYTALLEYQ